MCGLVAANYKLYSAVVKSSGEMQLPAKQQPGSNRLFTASVNGEMSPQNRAILWLSIERFIIWKQPILSSAATTADEGPWTLPGGSAASVSSATELWSVDVIHLSKTISGPGIAMQRHCFPNREIPGGVLSQTWDYTPYIPCKSHPLNGLLVLRRAPVEGCFLHCRVIEHCDQQQTCYGHSHICQTPYLLCSKALVPALMLAAQIQVHHRSSLGS